MYNPYDNNNQYPENNKPQENVNNRVNENQSSYTWNSNYNPYQAQNFQNQKTQEPEKIYIQTPVNNTPPQKKRNGTGKKIASFALCCLLSSAVSISAFSGMIASGFITVKGDDRGSSSSLSSAIDNSGTVSGTTTSTTNSGTLTKQQIAAKVTPSVVCIQNYAQTQSYSFFGQQTQSSAVSLASEGTGIIMSEDGYIVTNAHVVDGASALKVILSDGTEYEAELMGQDNVTDLAVIKVDGTGLTTAEFGSSSDLQVADEVIAIGNPGGLSLSSSATFGYVSALDRQITIGEDGYIMSVIQTDTAINPGNSGGALVNSKGQVIGINSSKLVKEGYEGIGFAIPIDTAMPIIEDLKTYGFVKDRAAIGISGEFIDTFTASYNKISSGMFIRELTSQNAKDSGLKVYDIITKVNGVSVTGSGTITSLLTTMSAGDTVTLTIDRPETGEKDLEIEIVLSQYSTAQ